jgi:poly(A) polymerase Pap1
MAEVDKRLGITPPISTTLPTDQDTQANTTMIEELRKQNTFESPSGTQKRYVVNFPLASQAFKHYGALIPLRSKTPGSGVAATNLQRLCQDCGQGAGAG